MSSKLTQLKEFSNPEFVSWKAQQMGLNPVYESSRKDKKYMVFDGKKMVHFGQFKPPYEDYTKHGDEKRRDNFRKRNMRWAYARKYSPAWLSFHLLW
jgi:hypothetical protein